ncbi:MAG: hint module-domain-containing protein [Monoraphidium minutum]|nr:MAG: hint module-domain-containing protein [Monoraphidium minutum]
MDELRVGDRVLAAGTGGALEYQDVYFFGHRDAAAAAAFVRLELSSGDALELTPDHFVPVLPAAASDSDDGAAAALAGARMTYARDVAAGDVMLVVALAGGGLARASVVRASEVMRAGLFNPYTLGGSIVVDGVLASAHSGWLVDGAAAALGASHRLPAFFQALLAPLRGLYHAAGPELTAAFGDALATAALRLDAFAAGGGAAGTAPAAAAAAAATAAAALAGAAAARKRAARA